MDLEELMAMMPDADPETLQNLVYFESLYQGADDATAQAAAQQAIPSPGADPGGNFYGSPGARLQQLSGYEPPDPSVRKMITMHNLRGYDPMPRLDAAWRNFKSASPRPVEDVLGPRKTMRYQRPTQLSEYIRDERGPDLVNPIVAAKEKYDLPVSKRRSPRKAGKARPRNTRAR